MIRVAILIITILITGWFQREFLLSRLNVRVDSVVFSSDWTTIPEGYVYVVHDISLSEFWWRHGPLLGCTIQITPRPLRAGEEISIDTPTGLTMDMDWQGTLVPVQYVSERVASTGCWFTET